MKRLSLICSEEELSPRLPLLETLNEELGGLDGGIDAIFGLQHLFGSTVTLIRTLAGDRIAPRNVFLLGKPYSAHPAACEFMTTALGYRVHPDTLVQGECEENDDVMDARIETMLAEIADRIRRGEIRRCLIIDDGARAIRLLHEERYADIRRRFVCVEQTRCGTRYLEDVDLEVPVLNVAESRAKLVYESPLISESVLNELGRQLAALERRGFARRRRALVIGYGSIGSAVARDLRERGLEVVVFDSCAARRDAAWRDGYPVSGELDQALATGDLIIGCTGLPVLDRDDYARIPDGTLLVSASSSDVEFRSWQLRAAGRNLGLHSEDAIAAGREADHPCFSLYAAPTGAGTLYLVNGGFPVNFSGGIDPIEPAKIQLTRSLLLLGAVLAGRTTRPGLIDLDEAWQARLLDLYEFYRSENEALEAVS